MYKQNCKTAPPPTTAFYSPDTNTDHDRQQHNKQLYCGYCDVQYSDATDLVEHCKWEVDADAVFADSGRDVFWQFEPPPVKEHNISPAVYV